MWAIDYYNPKSENKQHHMGTQRFDSYEDAAERVRFMRRFLPADSAMTYQVVEVTEEREDERLHSL